MKIKIKRVSKQALSIILAIMMLVSTMLIGTISVVAAGYNNPVYDQQFLYIDLSEYTSGKNLKGINGYKDDECSDGNFWYDNGVKTSDSENVYKFDLANSSWPTSGVNEDDYKNFRSFKIVFEENNNETTILIGSNGSQYNCYKVNSDATGGSWKTYGSEVPTGLTKPKLKGDSSVLPGSEVTVSLDNQKYYYNNDPDTDPEYKKSGVLDGLSFEFDVTASDGSNVAVTPGSCNKFVETDGTTPITAINDKITFTASSTEGVTYTVKFTVIATGYESVVSENFTVTTTSNSIKSENRIYAYAVALEDGATPTAPDAWVAAEKNADPQAVYKNKDAGNTYPSLGSTSETDLRIFLPSTASKEKVTLYNAFNSEIEVNSQSIPANSYATITYTPGAEMTVTGAANKTLTIYTSDAQGAVYLNNTGAYSGYTDAGVPKMITQLYIGKDAGAIGKNDGNTGAISDSNGTRNASVKKVKGRGNSTWDYTDKKSFNVTYNSAVDIAGVKAEKFSFLANYKDPSLSRNKILYELADKMGVSYSPDTATVDLYMNGLYMGSYLACQKVDIGADNLIKDVAEVDLTTTTTNFDFVMELDTKPAADDYAIQLAENRYLTMKSPELPSAEFDHSVADTFIRDKYQTLLNALNGTSKTALADIIDIDSLAKFYLLNELAKNYDIGVASTYFVYKASEGKFYASPIWDLDMAASNGKNTGSDMDKNFRDYEGNWTNSNNPLNELMRAAFNNVNVQAAARSIWTRDYYTELTGYLNQLQKKAHDVNVSLENNNKKWTQPYDFRGEFDDNLFEDDNMSLPTATYNVTTGVYTKNSNSTSYASTASGQIDFVVDWLKSRVAWMTQKYNKYYITGLGDWGDTSRTMTNNKNGINTYEAQLNAGTHTFKISSDGGAETYRSATAYSISYSPDMATNYVSKSTKITDVSVTNDANNNFQFKISENMTVYITYDQKTNTVTLSDQLSTTTNPAVTLNGSNVDNENIVEGTPVTLTATVTPASKDGVVLTGNYTVDLYRDGSKVSGQSNTVTFVDGSAQNVTFNTKLAGKSQKYTVKVSYIDTDGNTLTGESNSVEYRRTGLKDKKIYFDPSSIYDGNNQVWKSQMTPESTVTAYIKNSDGTTTLSSFTMSVDSEDMHGYDKGVFVANIDDETLALLQNPANSVVFVMVGKDNKIYATDNTDGKHPITITGDSRIRSGWIYNYSNESNEGNEQWKWEEYNVDYVEEYPHPERIKTYDDFKKYLIEQSETNTDNIVYFDNSASKWYNVYIYGWNDALGNGHGNDYGYLMKKLPYADIWYYDFGDKEPTSNFLFKDRGDYGFGSDYQQTVDLSDAYILNGYSEQVELKFASTINTANPIFVTNNFYKSTQQGGEGALKFRAFNTKWQEFADVVTSEVQTKAVNVFFDLHSNTADDIILYHTSNTDKFTFPSEFVRLTKLPDSTIYHASLLLPYSQKNGCEFKFTKFRVNGNDYAMGDASQPASTCINTGEVWYEVNSNYKNGVSGNSLDAQSADYSIVPNKTAVDTSSSVGAAADNNAVGANSYTIYVIPDKLGWTDYVDSTTGEIKNLPSDQNLLARVNYGTETNDNGWDSIVFDKDSRTIDGKAVYSVTLSLDDPGLRQLYIKIANPLNDDQTTKYTQVFGSWTNYGNFSNKVYDGSSLVDPQWDTVSTNWYLGGYVNGTPLGFADLNYQFTPDGNNIYKLNNVTFNTETQYLVVNDGKTTYLSNGETSTDSNPYVNEKWQVDSSTAKTFDFTWNATAKTLTWEVVPETSHTITNNATGVTANTAASVGTIVTIKPADSSKKITAVNLSVDAEITYNDDGTATFVMPDSDVTINSVTLVDKVVTPSVEYCAVLSYNHSTATFTSEKGGTITDAYVNLTNGNYQSDAIRTGYKTSENGTYTVIYALLPASATEGPTTSFVSTTAKDDSVAGQYNFNGWDKDGRVIEATNPTMTDGVISTSTVNYLAKWSEIVYATYTFTYKYDYFDTSEGYEYVDDLARLLESSDYAIMISLPVDSESDAILKAYKQNAPKIDSRYFEYSFENLSIDDLTITNNTEVSGKAAITGVKTYDVTVIGSESDSQSFNYQNVAVFTHKAANGKETVWTDMETNAILFVGDTYKFKVTKDTMLNCSEREITATNDRTYVNDATYEFFTSGSTEKVRFNIRVDNIIDKNKVANYGVIYFFTDSNGVPVDKTISVDDNIDTKKLTDVALGGNSNGGLKVVNVSTDQANAQQKYNFAPTMTNNADNKNRFIRVYSFIKTNDDEIILSENYVLASISMAG